MANIFGGRGWKIALIVSVGLLVAIIAAAWELVPLASLALAVLAFF